MRNESQMRVLALALLACIEGCSKRIEDVRTGSEMVCTGDQTKRAIWVQECIKNANPKSDEEPEDWIRECERVSIETYCNRRSYNYVRYDRRKVRCEGIHRAHELYDICQLANERDER